MGRVFRGLDQLSGAPVAVKVLLERRTAWDQRFARESETLASLQHPNIVRHVAHGVSGDERYLVMEWLEGEDLTARLARGALSVTDTLALARQVAEALALAHARGVVHRDLKPSNLWLVDGDIAQVKVLDFGVARLGANSSMSHAGMVVGTPGYMAPEQVRGGDDVDARADVFSLGAVLFECLLGRPLFGADHIIGMLAKILLDQVPSLHAHDPSIPHEVDQLLSCMLAKTRNDRPPHGAAVMEALHTLREGASPPRAPELPVVASTLSARERRTLSLVLVGNGVPSSGETPNFEEVTPGIAEEHVRRIVSAHRGAVELLADGTAIASFQQPDANAIDQAARAARCALALAPVCPRRPISIVTSRTELSVQAPLGGAVDRAAAALSRLEADPHGGPIAVDELTAQLLDARFELAPGPHGGQLRAERAPSSATRRLLGKETECVGREFELSTLEATLRACVEERTARAVLVSAPAGLGKSRLGSEFAARARRIVPGCEVWVGQGDPLAPTAAFGLLAHALRTHFELRESDGSERACARIHAGMPRGVTGFEAARVAAFLGELLGAPFPDGEFVQLRTARRDAQLMNAQMQRAFIDFLRVVAERSPVILLLEDLHWGDLSSVRFLDAALRELGEHSIMVLALARPEVHERFPNLWAERGVQHVHLRALSPQASARLVRRGLGAAASEPSISRVVALAEGNAFYLEELTRALVENDPQSADDLPETVLAMVEARLDKLDEESRRVLRAASVFGTVFWEGGVLELLGASWNAVALHASLSRLCERELLVPHDESRFTGEREFSFRHALLREGAYARLTEHDRRLGHRVAAHWLERLGESNAAALALHLERGGELQLAAHRYLAAANTALAGADFDAVLAHARRGLACGVDAETAVSLHGLISLVHGLRNQYREAGAHMDEVRKLSPEGTASRLAYELLPVLVRTLEARSVPDVSELLFSIDEAVAVGPDPETLDMFGSVLSWAHFELDAMGFYELAAPRAERFAEALRTLEPAETTAAGWRHIVAAYRAGVCMDRPLVGLAHAEDALAAFQLAGHPARELARVFVGLNAQALGAHEEAYDALHACRNADVGTISSLRDFLRVLSLLDAGQGERALRDALEMLERTRRRNPAERGRAHWALALVHLRAGDLPRAERELQDALVNMGRWPAEQCAALLTGAALCNARGEPEHGLASIERAGQLLAELHQAGYRGPLLRVAPVRRASVLKALGRLDEARAEVRVARTRALAMAQGLEDAKYRKSFLERDPHCVATLALARELGVD